jgi:glycosyltransferase involved in cell wall biosynthesis
MAAGPCVVVGVHDGFYGAGTGAGYANRAFLTTLAALLGADVALVLMPVFLATDSPEYQKAWHDGSLALARRVGATVLPVDNGTKGQVRFGGVEAFTQVGESTTATLVERVLPHASPLAVVLFDVPFLGVARGLPAEVLTRVVVVPRSTGLLHDPANAARIRFERQHLKLLAARGGGIAPISRYMRTHLRRDYDVPDSALLDLPDGMTAEEWRYRPSQPVPLPEPAQAGYLFAYGRAQPYKGWDDLIDALSRLTGDGIRVPHAILAAVTDQPQPNGYQAHLAQRIRARGLSATLLTRFDPDIRRYLTHPALRAVVVASRTEPFGRVPLEAYALGAGPVVATTAGGLAEQVVDGVTGFTAAPADPASLAAAIARALSLDDTDRNRMREGATAFARTHFDHQQAVRGFFAGFAPWVCRDDTADPAGEQPTDRTRT